MWHLPETEMAGRPHVTELAARIGEDCNGRNGVDLKSLLVSNAVDRLSGSGRMERIDGSVLEYHSVLLPDGGVLNSFLNVSDSVRVEQALRDRNAALEDADRLKLDFLANVSYQLRTPLNAMIGFAEMLIKQYSGPLNDKQMGYARGTLEAGERLVMLVDAVLDLSTIEAGYMHLNTAMVYIDDILDDIHVLVDEWARKQEVALVIDCPVDVGAIEADERRLKQVLSSLISNALKFTPAGGTITLSARRRPVVEGEEPQVTITVTDTGDGIPQADQARIFEPFEHGRTRRSTSTGVGLALVRSFITLHGGHVELESTQGVGTSVVCYLPVTRPEGLDAG
jgi:signal transduction histidine kinase